MPELKVPERYEVAPEDCWDLSSLYPDEKAWETDFEILSGEAQGIARFEGTLAESAARLKECLDFMTELEKREERLGYYAHLRVNENEGDSSAQERFGRYMALAARIQAAASYQTPEIQAIPDAKMKTFLADPLLEEYRIVLRKILRFKPHVLNSAEERLLAQQTEANQTAQKAFSALTNVDMEFGSVTTPEGEKPLTQSSFSSFLINPDRQIRREAYTRFYDGFAGHQNTLAALYGGSVQLDVYKARVRNYPSSRAAALFPDKVPETVYDNLLDTVHKNLPRLHRYYDLRRRVLGLDKLSHYDVYVPLVRDIQVKHSYNEAVEVIAEALKPLGSDYVDTLTRGLTGGWVDRYENKGKRSGAFSAGSYAGDPYILMNYKEEVLRDLFTLAHEGGHSMHSWYSARNNPFQHYSYTIFEAEVASTVNEQLLGRYLLERAESREMKAYLLGKQADDIIATIFRQSMFAEFEHLTHQSVEENRPLTVESLRGLYRGLLEKFFGPHVELPEQSDLEGLRIPHFYRAFYVYKYATGLSAAIALAGGIMDGGESERSDYRAFLKSGGSRYPLESLAAAGVDMSRPEPVEAAMERFGDTVERLEGLLTER